MRCSAPATASASGCRAPATPTPAPSAPSAAPAATPATPAPATASPPGPPATPPTPRPRLARGRDPGRPALDATGSRVVDVVEPGLLSMIQDEGRTGVAGVGVPPAGAADPDTFRLANRLVGNDDGAAAIEVTARGPTLAFGCDTHVAVVAAGGEGGVTLWLDGHGVPDGTVLPVRSGQVLTVGTVGWGLRAYIGLAGGVELGRVVGSRSSDRLCGLGPGPLQAGDRLALGASGMPHGRVSAGDGLPRPGTHVLRVLPGPHRFAPGELARFTGRPWTVGRDSDRVGSASRANSPSPPGRRCALDRHGDRRRAGATGRRSDRAAPRPRHRGRLPRPLLRGHRRPRPIWVGWARGTPSCSRRSPWPKPSPSAASTSGASPGGSPAGTRRPPVPDARAVTCPAHLRRQPRTSAISSRTASAVSRAWRRRARPPAPTSTRWAAPSRPRTGRTARPPPLRSRPGPRPPVRAPGPPATRGGTPPAPGWHRPRRRSPRAGPVAVGDAVEQRSSTERPERRRRPPGRCDPRG